MIYVHENNFNTKINSNYKGKAFELKKFKKEYYEKFRKEMFLINFNNEPLESFKKASNLINGYYENLSEFIKNNNITSQSKLESTFLEELSVYFFKDIPEIKSKKLDFYNKGIFAGLKINSNLALDIIKKDVDFCIGRRVNVTIENQNSIALTIPIISVEVKTYLDATMFGEIKSSSKTLKSATPNSRAYVLMGKPIDFYTLYLYWKEITDVINNLTATNSLKVPGRLLSFNGLPQEHRDNSK